MSMVDAVTQVTVGGIVALLILREVFSHLQRRKDNGIGSNTKGRRDTDKLKSVQASLDAVLQRLDRIVERLEDVVDATRAGRKQSEITGEMTERMCRAVATLEETINEAGRRRTADTQPGV